MRTGLSKELNLAGLLALRDYAVETYRTGGQWRGVEQDTIAVEEESFSSSAALYYPGFIRGSGWHNTDSGQLFDPYTNPPVPLAKFMEGLASFNIGSPHVIACSSQYNDCGLSYYMTQIPEETAEEWKTENREACNTPLEDGYRSFLLFYPNTGAYWIVSDYPDNPDERVIEDAGDASREELLLQFQTMLPEESEENLLQRYFVPSGS